LFSRYYEEFKIDRKTGESNLTQFYLLVSESALLMSKAVWLRLSFPFSGAEPHCIMFHHFSCKAVNGTEYNVNIDQSGDISLAHQNIKAQKHKLPIVNLKNVVL